jgi:hypothetical protein
MTDILDYIGKWSVLTWILLVLIAGFIGQFGKMLAQAVIRKIQLARLKRLNPSTIESPPTEDHSMLPGASAMKEPHAQSPAPDGDIDKKALKILAKISKKEAKKNK